jgi:hypothetical protein
LFRTTYKATQYNLAFSRIPHGAAKWRRRATIWWAGNSRMKGHWFTINVHSTRKLENKALDKKQEMQRSNT